jgi:hypothetical protein
MFLMFLLNRVWTLTDLVYIPLVHLTPLDFYVKVAVNAVLLSAWRPAVTAEV